MRLPITDLPPLMDSPGASVRAVPWGGMSCNVNQFAAGTDLAPLFKGLPNDMCPCPHWGYVLKGAIQVRYTDGREEVVRAGELFYWPPGHSVAFPEESAYVEFSPEQELNQVLTHIGRSSRG